MKTIAILVVIMMLLLNALGPHSSVGGPVASFFVSIFIAWVVGLYFAWSKSFGVLGWLLSMIVAIVGGFACIALLGTLMDTILTLTNFQGRLIDTNWSYLAEATLAVATVVGAWAPLELASRVNALR